MNERQEYALLHPINSARGSVPEVYKLVRKDRGLLLMSILAVDR